MPRALRVIRSMPPTQRQILDLLRREANNTKNLAFELKDRLTPLATLAIIRSAVPKTALGADLASIRNDLARIRSCLRVILVCGESGLSRVARRKIAERKMLREAGQ